MDGQPVVTEIACVEDLAGGAAATQFTVTPVFERRRPSGPLVWTGAVPARLGQRLERSGTAVVELLDAAGATGPRASAAEHGP